jgi:hypothetical protein
MLRYVFAAGLVAALFVGPGAVAQDVKKKVAERNAAGQAAPVSKGALTAESMEELHQLIRPQKGEYPWDEIPWYASIWHARKAAAEEDKPIFVFGTGGAGFNDPLGNC